MLDLTPPIFRPRRLGHVNLFVDDLDRSTRFYNAVCGLAIEFTETGLKAQFLGTGNTPHDLGMIETTKGVARYGRDGHLQIPATVGRTPALNHLAWEMATEAELVDSYKKWRAAGRGQARLSDHQIAHSMYFSDPDGNPLEFYVDTVRDWRAVLRGEIELISSAWNPDAAPPNPEPMYDENPVRREVSGAPIAPYRLTHVVLTTADMPRLADFYTRVAGLTVMRREEGGRAIFLRAAHDGFDYNLALLEAAPGERVGMHHFSFELADETALTRAEAGLAVAGVEIERRVDTPAKRSLFLIDPDGMRVEFYARRASSLLSSSAAPGRLDPFEL